MTIFRTILTLALFTLPLGCLDVPEEGHDPDPALEEAEDLGADGDQLAGSDDVFTAAVRYCVENFDCNSTCACINGTCQPDGFGPPPEGDYCAQPPQRACTSNSDCRSGCACMNGLCQETFGPFPEGNYCARPLPDAYEDNNHHSSATGYLGSPQTGHNFHDPAGSVRRRLNRTFAPKNA